jgi:DNA-binding NarL/FixJ family response regulator
MDHFSTVANLSERPLSVVLVDDHTYFRRGLRGLLEARGIVVGGEAASGEQSVELVGRLRPDVVVMDLRMPGMSGVAATRALVEAERTVRVLVLTTSAEEHDLLEALAAGACGYVVKDAPVADIVAGIEAAAIGESVISPSVAHSLVELVRTRRPHERFDGRLTERETQILRLVGGGYDNRTIGERLHISPSTVKSHLSVILEKLGADNRVQAAVWAARHGLL